MSTVFISHRTEKGYKEFGDYVCIYTRGRGLMYNIRKVMKLLQIKLSDYGLIELNNYDIDWIIEDTTLNTMVNDILDATLKAKNLENDLQNDRKGRVRLTAKQIIQAAENVDYPSFSPTDTETPSPLVVLGMILTIARRKRNLDTEKLSEITGLDSKTIFLIEKGLASFGTVSENLRSLCDALGLDYPDLSKRITYLTLPDHPQIS